MNISVAIATFNGEKYISEQLKSILIQLDIEDEIIISDDNSEDNTIKIVEAFNDRRIKIIKNKKKGIIKNFENAILNCKNEIIFLADQDDVWKKNKVSKILEIFKENDKTLIVQSNFYITNENLEILSEGKLRCKGFIGNIIKNSYMGSAMAFRKSILKYTLPFPKLIPMHDMWIGIISKKYGKVKFIDDKLFYYRRHKNAVTLNSGNLSKKLMWRINLIISICSHYKRKKQ